MPPSFCWYANYHGPWGVWDFRHAFNESSLRHGGVFIFHIFLRSFCDPKSICSSLTPRPEIRWVWILSWWALALLSPSLQHCSRRGEEMGSHWWIWWGMSWSNRDKTIRYNRLRINFLGARFSDTNLEVMNSTRTILANLSETWEIVPAFYISFSSSRGISSLWDSHSIWLWVNPWSHQFAAKMPWTSAPPETSRGTSGTDALRLGWRWRTSTSMRSTRPSPPRPPCALV